MKSIYVVQHGNYEYAEPLCAFESEEDADKIAHCIDGTVYPVTINPTIPEDWPNDKRIICLSVHCKRRGLTFYSGGFDYFAHQTIVVDGRIALTEDVKFDEPQKQEKSISKEPYWELYVWAEDFDDAKKKGELIMKAKFEKV